MQVSLNWQIHLSVGENALPHLFGYLYIRSVEDKKKKRILLDLTKRRARMSQRSLSKLLTIFTKHTILKQNIYRMKCPTS